MPPTGLRATFERFRLHLLAMQPAVRTAAGMGLALVVGLFAYTHIPQPRPAVSTPKEIVTAGPSEKPIWQTTSEVAGREFIWTESRGWIQRGLEGKTPEVQVEAGSPKGRELLSRYSGLSLYLQDGYPVVLRYNLGTVEIRPKSPTRVLGYERDFRPGQVAEA